MKTISMAVFAAEVEPRKRELGFVGDGSHHRGAAEPEHRPDA